MLRPREQRVFFGGKILVHRQRVAERNQRHQIRRLHLGTQKCLCRFDAAIQVFRLHRGQIKKHHDQTVIEQVFRLGHHHCLASSRPGSQSADCGFLERPGHVDALIIERGNLLRLAVFQDRKVALLQPVDKLPRLGIARYHVGQHKFGIRLQNESAFLCRRDLPTRGRSNALRNNRRRRRQHRQAARTAPDFCAQPVIRSLPARCPSFVKRATR